MCSLDLNNPLRIPSLWLAEKNGARVTRCPWTPRVSHQYDARWMGVVSLDLVGLHQRSPFRLTQLACDHGHANEGEIGRQSRCGFNQIPKSVCSCRSSPPASRLQLNTTVAPCVARDNLQLQSLQLAETGHIAVSERTQQQQRLALVSLPLASAPSGKKASTGSPSAHTSLQDLTSSQQADQRPSSARPLTPLWS